MTRARANELLHDLKHVTAVMREEHAAMDAEDPDSIKPHVLALRVLNRLDPKKRSITDVRMLAHASLVHMASGLCANVHRNDEQVHEQTTMFDAGLQPRYPVERGGEAEYVKRSVMTIAELRANAARLRKESEAKAAHAAALDAETDDKIASGYFNDDGVPHCALSPQA